MDRLEQGRIVWARVSSPKGGECKQRPLVILTATAEITPNVPFVAVAGTTQVSKPLPPDRVHLPWHPTGNVRTRLRKPTVVVCDWLVELRVEDVIATGGIVPPTELGVILSKVTQGLATRIKETPAPPP